MEVYDRETLINDARRRAESADSRIAAINQMLSSNDVTDNTVPSKRDLVLQRSLAYDDYEKAIHEWGELLTV